MSAEALTIASIVDEGAGGLRKVYQGGVTGEDFVEYEEEFQWIEDRVARRKPLNVRLFRRKFPDFEWMTTDERLQDLLADLKNERAFMEMQSMLQTVSVELEVENAIDKAVAFRDVLTNITRLHAPVSDHALISGHKDYLKDVKILRSLRQGGQSPGIPTGLAWIDHHWDGLVPGRFIVPLGRPGEGKSYLVAKFAAHAAFTKHRTLLFSPEMNRHEHTARIHTLLSAYPAIKTALGMKHSFRNRALQSGIGYNLKSYAKFMEYLEGECGEIILMTQTNRMQKMNPAFIEAKIADMGPDLVIVDPIYKLSAVRARDSRIAELSDISDALQDLAEQYSVPVVATNQAHRQMTHKEDAPHKDSSFNSDVPIQEADHVIGVKNISEEHRLILRCTKSRFGQDFRFECKFYPNTGVMHETSKPQGSYLNGNDEEIEDEELQEIVDNATRSGRKTAS